MRQVCIVPSGAQQWMREVFAAGGGRFAYVSTLAIYIYRLRGFVLEKILVGHDRMITAITWSPHDARLLASASSDHMVKVWDVDTETPIAEIKGLGFSPSLLRWTLTDSLSLLMVHEGRLHLLDIRDPRKQGVTLLKNFASSSKINSISLCPRDRTKVAVGLEDHNVHVLQMAKNASSKIALGSPVVEVAWDPRSENYLLVAQKDGKISLYDTEAKEAKEVSVFARHSGGLRALAWVPEIPGGFVTVSERNGVIRMWNVSQNAPTELLKTGKDGFHHILFVSSDVALCGFKDGMVAVYNMGRKQVEWSTEGGHTETIFDCGFKSTDPNVLATASYDSTVRLWDIRNATCISKLTGSTGVLYSLSWSPDGTLMASSSSEGKIFIYDVEKGVVVRTVQTNKEAIYRVAWSARDANLLACASQDTTCVVTRSNGQVQRVLKHPGAVFGCAWSPFETNTLATSCYDHNVYLWHIGTPQESSAPVVVLHGHKAKVFNVAWSPLLPDMLLSGSDDRTARVWNVSTKESQALVGHTMNVRGLLWHSEIPYLCMTGSWDSTIRLWDVRTAICITIVVDHHADVYGVAAHPQRPFVISTASRDTTIRLWSLDKQYSKLKVRALCGEDVLASASQANAAMAEQAHVKLSGAASAHMMKTIQSSQSQCMKFATVFDFFSLPSGTFELWRLAEILHGGYQGTRSSVIKVPHQEEMMTWMNSKAVELEATVTSTTRQFLGAGRKEEVLNQAAITHLQLGNVERYCEIMRDLGEWERAIALAPAVSHELWAKLVKEYAAEKLSKNAARLADLLPWYIAINQPETLVNLYLNNEQYEDAVTLAQVAAAGGYNDLTSSKMGNGASAKGAAPGAVPRASRQQVHTIRNAMAESYSSKGESSWAACCHLSVDDVHLAVFKLLKGNEIEIAVVLGWAMKVKNCSALTNSLARICEGNGDWELSYKLLSDPSKVDAERSQRLVELAVARRLADIQTTPAAGPPGTDFYKRLGLETCASYAAKASQQADPASAVLCHLLGCQMEEAVEHGLAFLRTKLASTSWCMEELDPLMEALSCVPALRLPQATRNELLAYCSYIGGIKAIYAGYHSVVSFLMEQTRQLVRTNKITFAVPLSLISMQELSYKQYVDPSESARGLSEISCTEWVGAPLREAARQMHAFAVGMGGAVQLPTLSENMVVPSSASMPSGGNRKQAQLSLFTGKPIVGPIHVLEDGHACISMADAVMYSRVSTFSPLHTGAAMSVK